MNLCHYSQPVQARGKVFVICVSLDGKRQTHPTHAFAIVQITGLYLCLMCLCVEIISEVVQKICLWSETLFPNEERQRVVPAVLRSGGC